MVTVPHPPNFKKYGVPSYAVAWVPPSQSSGHLLAIAGGGGEGSSGIPNAVLLSHFDLQSNSLSDQPVSIYLSTYLFQFHFCYIMILLIQLGFIIHYYWCANKFSLVFYFCHYCTVMFIFHKFQISVCFCLHFCHHSLGLMLNLRYILERRMLF